MRLKNAQHLITLEDHTEAEEKRRTFTLKLDKIMQIVCFSANVRQCNLTRSVEHVDLCL